MGETISQIVVAGGGICGWSAATALKRRVPGLEVTIIPVPPPPDALADSMMSTLPSIAQFHRDIGLPDADTIVRAGSAYRLGTSFEDWCEDRPSYVHAYGEHGRPFGTASFHHHWIRASHRGLAAAFDCHSPAAAIAKANRFVPPKDDPGHPLSRFEYGLQITPPRYRAMMEAYGLHLGVRVRAGAIGEVRLRGEDGFIDSVRLDTGDEVRGDLFVDCTGPDAQLRSALDSQFDDWSRWLLCDRMLFAVGAPPTAELPSFDRAIAIAAGWRWEAASPLGTSCGMMYSSAHLSDAKAERALRVACNNDPVRAPVTLRQGRRPEPWLRNCVAVGDSAATIDLLEWTNLHLAHSQIDRIISMMPDRDFAPVELADYNRQCNAELDRVRDFVLLHYLAANRPSQAFWKAAAAVEPPASLAHTLALFKERGRLPFHEEETFSRDSWLAVLLGQGVIPRRVDPLIESVPADQADQAMAQLRQTIDSVVATLPGHAAFLQNLARQVLQ